MALTHYQLLHRVKPAAPRINWGHRFSEGLVFHCPVGRGQFVTGANAVFTDIVNDYPADTLAGTGTVIESPMGSAFGDHDNTQPVIWTDTAVANPTGNMSVAIWIYAKASGTTERVLGRHDSGSNGWLFSTESTTTNSVYVNGTRRINSANLPRDQWVMLQFSLDGTNIHYMTDYVLSTGSSPHVGSNTVNLVMCGYTWSGRAVFEGYQHSFSIWNRYRSPEEMRAFRQTLGLELYEPITLEVRPPASAGLNVSANTAAYGWAEQAASINASRNIAATAATVNWAEQAATVSTTGNLNISATTAAWAWQAYQAEVTTGRRGGLSMTLAQMRRRERQQLLQQLRRDDDEILALLLARLRGRQ